MSEAKPDLDQIAAKYRNHLTSELTKIDAFIEMSKRLKSMDAKGEIGVRISSGDEGSLDLH